MVNEGKISRDHDEMETYDYDDAKQPNSHTFLSNSLLNPLQIGSGRSPGRTVKG